MSIINPISSLMKSFDGIRRRSLPWPAMLMLLAARGATAQKLGDIVGRWEVGLGVEMVELNERSIFNNQLVPGRSHRETAKTLTMSVAWNLPVVPLGDKLAIGISPALGGLLGPMVASVDPITGMSGTSAIGDDNAGGFALVSLNAPILAMLNYGTDASFKRPHNSFGASIGAGYQESWLVGSSFFYGMPVLAAEVGFHGSHVYKLRGTMPLAPHYLSDSFTVSQYNVSFYFTF